MHSRSYLLVLCALLCGIAVCWASPYRERPYAPANSASQVVFGDVRVTLLTDCLFRLEYSPSGVFDDRATVTVVNRQMPTPQFSVAHPNASSVVITLPSSGFTITYVQSSLPARVCGPSSSGLDAVNAVRSTLFPNGVAAANLSECCALCLSDGTCSATVFEPNATADAINCWPLCGYSGTYSHSSRIFIRNVTNAHGCSGDVGWFPGSVLITGPSIFWTQSTQALHNLNGTYTALDCYSTPGQCYEQYWQNLQLGLLSLDGWATFDDTLSMRFAPAPANAEYANYTWWSSDDMTDAADVYFLGYGQNYKQALYDWSQLSGPIALPPRQAFGVWYSDYFRYSQETYVEGVLAGYANYSIPLHVAVLDMDWHTEPTTPGCQSWGGYDWNTTLFPDPVEFLQYLKNASANVVGRSLWCAVNLHPETGVDHCQLRYPAVAQRNGIDPRSNVTVPCDFSDLTYTESLFDVYLSTEPLSLVDIFWTDYGGCGGLYNDPLLWSNYVYDSYPGRYPNNRRPLVLSRNGGMGDQRYPVGFSGDTFQHELSLDWEIQTTPMAANVLMGYWSHDIGGFHAGAGAPGDANPLNYTGSELFLRWVQAGVFFPIFRTHCDHCERRIWNFQFHFPWLLDAFKLRNALLPYIYTEARAAFDTAVALLHPLYYEYPSTDEAYIYAHQYFFGRSIVVAPISALVQPYMSANGTVAKTVWVPPGQWSFWSGGPVLSGPQVYTANYTQAQIPAFVPTGTLLALQTSDMASVGLVSPPLVWTVWLAARGSSGPLGANYTVYEDDGVTLQYAASGDAGQALTTAVYFFDNDNSTLHLRVFPTVGSFQGQSATRAHLLQLRASTPLAVNVVTLNGNVVRQSNVVVPGWYVVPQSEDSLTAPAGSLVVNGGVFPNIPLEFAVYLS